MNNYLRVIAFLLGVAISTSIGARVEVQSFDSESQRQRYSQMVDELRCPKCQNQNLWGSNSEIAIDLRNEVARLIKEGNSDREIKDYMVQRYGDFVLYRPPVQSNTLVLWWAPVFMLGVGVLVFVIILVKRKQQPARDEASLAEPHTATVVANTDDSSNSDSAAISVAKDADVDEKQVVSEREEALSEEKEALSEEGEALSDKKEALSEEGEALSDKKEALSEEGEALSDKKEALSDKKEAVSEENEAEEKSDSKDTHKNEKTKKISTDTESNDSSRSESDVSKEENADEESVDEADSTNEEEQ